MPSTGGISKPLKQQKTDVQNKRRDNGGKKKALEALRAEVQNNPDKKDEIEAISQEIGDIQKEEDTLEAEEKRLDSTIPMEMDGDSPQSPTPQVGKASSATQAQDATNEGENDPTRNDLGQGGSGDDNINNDSNMVYPSPPSTDNEEAEMPMMTVTQYKQLTGSPTEGCQVVAWKPATRSRGKEVINRYGPKSHPKFRIEAASEAFDEHLPEITAPGYRIGEKKINRDRDWAYNYQNVAGIIAVAIRVQDEKDPLRAIDPAYHTKGRRYTETQVLIQWKNIEGDDPTPRSWEKRGTAQRVCPMRKKGVADKMIWARAKQCEEAFDRWYQNDSKGRDKTMSPAPFIKVEEVSEPQGDSSSNSSKSVNAPESQEKSAQSEVASSISTTSPAPVEVGVSAPKVAQASSASSFNRDDWLADYCDIYGPKESMNDDERAQMVNAFRKAKAEAAATA